MTSSRRPEFILILVLLILSCRSRDAFQEVPYVRQGPDSNCYQACLMMMLKNFFPEQDYTLRQMDRLTGRKPNHWTFEAQLVEPLLDRGLEVKLFATTEYDKISPEYISKKYGPHVISLIDYGSVRRAAGFLKPEIFSKKKLEWKELEKYFRKGYLTMLCVDENALRTGRAGRFSGHGIILVGLSGDIAYIHDPKKGPNMEVPKENLINAWHVKGTDNAVLFVRKKNR